VSLQDESRQRRMTPASAADTGTDCRSAVRISRRMETAQNVKGWSGSVDRLAEPGRAGPGRAGGRARTARSRSL